MFIEMDQAKPQRENRDGVAGSERSAAALPVPLYEHLKRRMSEAILLGEWPPGTVLPGEIALAAQYGVAVGTLRRALADLAAEGLVVRRRKTGTVVTGRSPHHSLRFFFQYFRLHGADGRLLHSTPEVLSLTRGPPTAQEAAAFALGADDEVIRIRRIRWVEGRPAMCETLSLPAARLLGFATSAADVPDMLYLHLLDHYGIRIAAVRESLTAVLADAEDRRLLGLAEPAAVLVMDVVAYDQAGAAMILEHRRASTAHHCYINEVR